MSHFSIGYCPEEKDNGRLIRMIISGASITRSGVSSKRLQSNISHYLRAYLLAAQPINAALAKTLSK